MQIVAEPSLILGATTVWSMPGPLTGGMSDFRSTHPIRGLTFTSEERSLPLIFTHQADSWLRRMAAGVVLSAVLGMAGLYYYGPPEYTRVGYAPTQPVPFSHEQHAGRLGMSCLYCHTGVEDSSVAKIPPTQTCMNCHQAIKSDSPQLEAVRVSWTSGDPGSLGAGPPDAGLRLLQPFRPCEARGRLRQLSRQGQRDAGRRAREAAQHGLVPGLPPASRRASQAARGGDQLRLATARGPVSARLSACS